MQLQISFRQANLLDKETIFNWLNEPHMREFWDNSQKHRDDIIAFLNGRKENTGYFGGNNVYWIGLINGQSFAFIITRYEIDSDDTPKPYRSYVSQTGKTIGLDFGIGNPEYIGKGLSSIVLESFVDYYIQDIDPSVDTFFIDPFLNNPRAIHVYQKAGFEIMANFTMQGGYFDQNKGVLMVKTLK